jgi:hypothetical protein
MVRYSLITLFTLIIACIVIYAIWTAKVSRDTSNELMNEFKKINESLKKTNDSFQNDLRKDSFRFPAMELSLKANAITSCIDSIKHDLVLLSGKQSDASFSYPDKTRVLELKTKLSDYNSFIEKNFTRPDIKPADLVNIEQVKTSTGQVPWEVYFFENTNIFAVITELNYINKQVQKLKQKALR